MRMARGKFLQRRKNPGSLIYVWVLEAEVSLQALGPEHTKAVYQTKWASPVRVLQLLGDKIQLIPEKGGR